MKYRTVDGRDGSWSHSSRQHHSGFNGCCTAMWNANGKTTTLVLFLDSLFPKVWKRLWTCHKTNYYLKKLAYMLMKVYLQVKESCHCACAYLIRKANITV
jgi:predicted house-cleaning NTP pyrophosphatase (Maf/HAM1 superfamily)